MATTAPAGSCFFSTVENLPPQHVVFGRTRSMVGVQQRVEKVAGANIPVLIQGESGTGKEILARYIHRFSPWEDGPFVKVNCPAIPGTLLESELFGYEKGAFTGAYGTKPGRIELAHRGTLFMDEISELEPALQAKLLQILQDGQFCRIGAQEDKRLHARVVCATNRQLEEEIAAGTFRQDLYYRINVLTIHVPPLRERLEDIKTLLDYFLELHSKTFRTPVPPLSAQIIQLLQQYDWPGNIRQLENLIKRYVILGSEEAIIGELTSPSRNWLSFRDEFGSNDSIPLKKVTRQAVQALEREIILKVLQSNHWNRKRAARALGISYRALLYKIRQANLPPSRGLQPTGTESTGLPLHAEERGLGVQGQDGGRPPLSRTGSDFARLGSGNGVQVE